MKQSYVSRAKQLVKKEYYKLMKDQVYPLTSLPIELNLEIEIEEGYFHASAAIGHPHFGYFGLGMKGMIVDLMGFPLSLVVDAQKAFIYPLKVQDNQLVINTESNAYSTTSAEIAALVANKLLFINNICTNVVPEDKLETLADNINQYINVMMTGRI